MQSPRCMHACFFRTKTTLFLPAAIVMCVTVFRSGATAELCHYGPLHFYVPGVFEERGITP